MGDSLSMKQCKELQFYVLRTNLHLKLVVRLREFEGWLLALPVVISASAEASRGVWSY